ncbi:hypothetical protein PR202_gb19108 [Eleusine coracana subsp. coracana]|uniref:Protein kinase domain-containing protein n=1 Tax=Eleusine coracana subsp. coracana TaxID=191504 RepID=A0AAV5F7X0_ELECO|nr:hypothetical protein PR202_gb19108 [Eleusine coracana subsp. coracana]
MEPRHFRCSLLPLLLPVVVILLLGCSRAAAQEVLPNGTFACLVPVPCQTFVVYRTRSGFLDLGSISDLFSTSRARIASANTLRSEDGILLPGQPLLVPVTCGCTGAWSFANLSYPIRSGDIFWWLAGTAYANLTEPGQEVTVPLFCRCPTPSERRDGIQSLITYVWQPKDDMARVSELMNASVDAIAKANNVSRSFTSVMGPPMLIPVKQRPRLPPLRYGASTSGDGGDASRSRHRRRVVIAASVSGALVCCVLALCVAAFLAQRRYIKKASPVHAGSRFLSPKLPWAVGKNPFGHDSSSSSSAQMMIKGGGGGGDNNKLLAGVSQFIDKPTIFVAEEIMEATMDLDERCRIGTSYYKAKLDGEVFAVKPVKGGDVSAELRMMQTVNHANLIKLAGVSVGADGDYAFLVYEFAEKGSLDTWLYQHRPSPAALPSSSSSAGSVKKTALSWEQRLGVALDVANGLLYMHEHTQPSMVHGDVRARNILLTTDFRAKISSFALARPVTVEIDDAGTSSDVFGFGLLLLELLSGRRAVEARAGTEIGMLWREVRAVLEAVGDRREAKLRKWVDPALGSGYPIDVAVSLAAMARACTEEDAARRPKMTEIVFNLSMLAQPSSTVDAFEKMWHPSSDENLGIAGAVAAR